jgi:trehalose synthase
MVTELHEVEVPVLDLARFAPLVGERRFARLVRTAERARSVLAGTVVWHVNSTAAGGGVAEMLQVLIGYSKAANVDMRWVVLQADAEFFAVTKRLHNRLHGAAGDAGGLGRGEASHYEEVLQANAALLLTQVRPGDVVFLHDPQTAGLAPVLGAAGAHVLWRCHVGSDVSNPRTEEAWRFLLPYIGICEAYVFSRRAYAPPGLDPQRVWVIPPSIDPYAPKNQELGQGEVERILGRIGLLAVPPGRAPGSFVRRDGTVGTISHPATIDGADTAVAPGTPLVVQVSRWDRLKDMDGVLAGFAEHVVDRTDAQLALVGPAVTEVADDPEGAEVLAGCRAAWAALPARARARIRLVSLPMDDVDENAAMVNAVQRYATVVVQKSLAEGFGLTVAEAMWKGRAVVASAVGGIVDQVVPGTGLLLRDPRDLTAFGDALSGLLRRPAKVAALGAAAHRHVLAGFLGDRHLVQYAQLLEQLVTQGARAER